MKHGLSEKLRSKNGIISIFVETDETYLYLNVMDDGNGMDINKVQELQNHIDRNVDKRYGLGLKNVNDRIKLFYGKRYGIVIEAQEGSYTKITLKLPNNVKSTLINGINKCDEIE